MHSRLIRVMTTIVFVLALPACSGPEFNSEAPGKNSSSKKSLQAESMNVPVQSKSASGEAIGKNKSSAQASPESMEPPRDRIAAAGMSLDLHAIVDISGSLSDGLFGGTDPQCRRLDALKAFFKDLRNELGENPDARLSLTVFNSQAKFISTKDNFLNMTDAEFDAEYKKIICQSSGKTNAAAAFEIAADKAKTLMQESPKKVSSALVFTDGEPNVVPLEVTLQKAEKLREVFPERVFGIFLGQNNGAQASNFMKNMTGSENRVRRVAQIDDLANALSSFLK